MPKHFRKVVRITAEMSPNVRLALLQQAQGIEPTNEVLVPGVLTWADYRKRRATWDRVRQCVGLDADWYEGAEVMLFPGEWLDRAGRLALELEGRPRKAEAAGNDPAEGGDKTSEAVVDRLGLVNLSSTRTPDTSIVTGEAIASMMRYNVQPDRYAFDRGGGGKEHADRLRSQGYNVRTVAFGESLMLDPRRGLTLIEEKKEAKEERYAYFNRRAEMYGEVRLLLDPNGGLYADGGRDLIGGPNGFAIPFHKHPELRQQMAPIPLTYDPEGRLKLLPKNKRSPDSEERTLTEIIGHSPDELDALVLAVHAMLHRGRVATAGVFTR